MQLQKDKTKGNIVVKGLARSESEDCEHVIQDFFKTQMEITEEIGIRDCFRLGKGKTAAILVMLEKDKDKLRYLLFYLRTDSRKTEGEENTKKEVNSRE